MTTACACPNTFIGKQDSDCRYSFTVTDIPINNAQSSLEPVRKARIGSRIRIRNPDCVVVVVKMSRSLN